MLQENKHHHISTHHLKKKSEKPLLGREPVSGPSFYSLLAKKIV
jgi:hypothetical protein